MVIYIAVPIFVYYIYTYARIRHINNINNHQTMTYISTSITHALILINYNNFVVQNKLITFALSFRRKDKGFITDHPLFLRVG